MARRIAWLLLAGTALLCLVDRSAAQANVGWPGDKPIPDYQSETDTPVLVVDQNRTVHAFSSQWLEGSAKSIKAVVYNQWTLEKGWTAPVDILLSPLKEEARVLDAVLDQNGVMHVIFFGGDETEANVYYAQAPASRAGQAQAWSRPRVVGVDANSPNVGGLAADGEGNLIIVFSGRREGNGLYTLFSADGGATWTAPEPTFLTYGGNFPFILKLHSGDSGTIHAVWDVRDDGGNGRQINYAQLTPGSQKWHGPVRLATAESGYGVLIPTITEHDGELFVAYSGVSIIRSQDGGRTWSDPARPFRHTGINGIMSFVEDSGGQLHLLWAQRISGSPDTHGVWHSLWQDGHWTEPEPVVSGPAVPDKTGNDAFDPYDVGAAVSQGNMLLVTWRQDPGLKGNGVWYSYLQLDTPELEVVPLPETVVEPAEAVAAPTAVAATQDQPATISTPVTAVDGPVRATEIVEIRNPVAPIALGVLPVAAMLALGVLLKWSGVARRPWR